ncbi:MAG: sodium:solute symporter [Planctomycetaceae bacterium]|nr:sodium:solute symporter [Planctomycetaceae bacterium]
MLSPIDIAVLVVYVVGVVGFGCWFVRKSSTTAEFTSAGGSIAGWAVGLSIFGTFLSSNTFLGVPGKAYGSNWNSLLFSFTLPVAAWIATRWFVPFYRNSGEISAYSHLEHRFGPWARTYGVVSYLLMQFARVGTVLFGVSLALAALTGWPQWIIIVAAGALITLYTILGGIEAVIWTDVVQSLVLLAGAAGIIALLLLGMPEGPGQVFSIGAAEAKFSLGSTDWSLATSTVWVVLLYGLFMNLNNFGIDQSYVQRYHASTDMAQARRSVWLGALLYIPVSLAFFFIGTAAFAYYDTHPEMLAEVQQQVAEQKLRLAGVQQTAEAVAATVAELSPADVGDKVLPHFIVHALPRGVTGLVIAAIFAAAMSSIDTSLNSSATVVLSDIYRRYFRPQATERENMTVLYGATLVMGVLGTATALAMIGVQSVLDVWWLLSGVFAGGLLGLFLLGAINRRVGSRPAAVAVAAGLLATLGMAWPKLRGLFDRLLPGDGGEAVTDQPLLHENMTIVVGTLTVLVVGSLAGWLQGPRQESAPAAAPTVDP